jgi:hypothetical protein
VVDDHDFVSIFGWEINLKLLHGYKIHTLSDCSLVGCDTVYYYRRASTFREKILPISSGLIWTLKHVGYLYINRKEICLLGQEHGRTVKADWECSFEALVSNFNTACCCNPEYYNLNAGICQNLKFILTRFLAFQKYIFGLRLTQEIPGIQPKYCKPLKIFSSFMLH